MNSVLSVVNYLNFDAKTFLELEKKDFETYFPLKKEKSIKWLNVVNTQNKEIIDSICEKSNLSSFTKSVILDPSQYSNIYKEPEQTIIILKRFDFNKELQEVLSKHIVIVYSDDFIITFQEGNSDLFEEIQQNFKNNISSIENINTDPTIFLLLNTFLNHNFTHIMSFAKNIDDLKTILFNVNANFEPEKIYKIKKDLNTLIKQFDPIESIVKSAFLPGSISDNQQINDSYKFSLEKIITINKYIDSLKLHLNDITELQILKTHQRISESNQLLAIYAGIFIPLIFVTNIYAMNFKYMPEIYNSWAYYFILFVLILIAFLMAKYFKKKRWL